MKFTNDHRAFTLIELLVTCAIISILAGISLANFAEFKQKGNDLTAMSYTKAIHLGVAAQKIDRIKYQITDPVYHYNILPDGTYHQRMPAGTTIESFLPGLPPHPKGLHIAFYFYSPGQVGVSAGTSHFGVYHCKSTTRMVGGTKKIKFYQGWDSPQSTFNNVVWGNIANYVDCESFQP